MKKILSISLAAMLTFSFVACKKNNNSSGTNPFGTNTNNNNNTPPPVDPLDEVGQLPADFTKKPVLEEFTGEWCGYCPDGAVIMKNILTAHPETVIGIAVHDGDPFEVPSFNSWIKTLTNVSGYPNGSVDRADAQGRGSWTGDVDAALLKPTDCGLALVTKVEGTNANIKVFVGYKVSMGTDKRLTVVITEDEVAQSPGGQHDYATPPIVDASYTHAHVLRGVVTATEGDPIDLTSPKNYTIVEFKNVDLASMNITNMSKVQVAAFINNNTTPRDVYNAQKVELGQTKKWD